MRRSESVHFGQLLLARRLISAQQLASALAEQERCPYLRIGEILLGMGFLSFPLLKSNLEDQYRDVLLGQRLLEDRLVHVDQLAEALRAQEVNGARLGAILVELGHCSERQIYRILSEEQPA